MTPDEAFIFGRLADESRLIVAAGLSGHGFKFTPVLGELISQIASHQELKYDLTAFSPSRWMN
jgi:glycine/D-amino acid oxidase-like deaminating enzyme